MRARIAALAGAACLVALAGHAGASPYAGQTLYMDSGVIKVTGTDRSQWQLIASATVGGVAESRSSARIFLDLQKCKGSNCSQVGRWSRAATPGEVTISSDRTKGHLHAIIAGTPVDVAMSASDSLFSLTVYGAGLLASDGPHPAVGHENAATGSFTLGRMRCAASHGDLGDIEQVDAYGDDARWPASFPASLPKALVRGTCRG